MKATRFLLGTIVEIEARGEGVGPAISTAFAEIERVEALMSRFRPTSDVARLNNGRCQPVEVSPETFALLERALFFAELTERAFDITGVSGARPHFGDVLLDSETRTVLLRRPGTTVDLGGIAKGYAVDRAVQVLREMGVRDALVNAGGDLRTAGDGAWVIGIQHPRIQGGLLCRLTLTDQAVATSGQYYGRHRVRERRGGHILDPRRGKPARKSTTATVIADEAVTADALATAAFVLGPEEGLALIERLPGVAGLIAGQGGVIRISSNLGMAGQVWLPGSTSGVPDLSGGFHVGQARRFRELNLLGRLATAALVGVLAVGCQTGAAAPPNPTLVQPSPVATKEIGPLVDGVYRGESLSGVLVRVEVTVRDGRISEIQILEYREISSIHAGRPEDPEVLRWETTRDEVLKTIPQRMIEKQSVKVDAVTGATMSSETIMAAVENALSKPPL